MDRDYLKILAEQTPPPSTVKSSFIKKCIRVGSIKKELFDEGSSSRNSPNSDLTNTFLSVGNEANSGISGIYELDNSKVRSPFQKENVASTSRGEFDTTIFDADGESYTTDSMFADFLEFFLGYSGEHEVFNLLLNYEELCCQGFDAVSKMLHKASNTDMNLNRVTSLLYSLQMERNTWRLLRILFQDRIDSEAVDEGEMLMSTLGRASDKEIVENLYQRSSYIRQLQLIVDWLEKNADEDFKSTFCDKFEFFTDKCLALEHSLNELITANFRNAQDVQEMDPDAQFRGGGYRMHETDRENESRLFKFMFMCIRAGKLTDAQKLAEKFGELWLAAACEGWRLYHDRNFEKDVMEGDELHPTEGNKYRDLWKSACFDTSRSNIVPIHEQALCGSLCGNLKAVLPVCKTWEDFLWAYTKSSVDKLIEQEIRNSTQQDRSLEDLPAAYWDQILHLEEIFQELDANDSHEVKMESKNPHHVIQKYVILDDLGGLIEEMYSWLNYSIYKLDAHTLRCMTHIILFLRVIGQSTKEELCVPILEAYVQELIKSHKVTLVAPYTSTLPKEQQIIWYAKFLEGITDNDERQKCLQFAEDAGLDVLQITKAVVKNIREKDTGSFEMTTDLSSVTSQDDVDKIHAIDWLIFNPTQRAEAMKQANAIMRIFVAQRKTDAAKTLFNKIPQDSVAVMMQLSKSKGLDELSADDDNTTREYLCFKAYLEAIDSFSNWFHHSMHSKPKEPTAPSGEHVTFKEKVAHEHEMQQFQKDLERWQSVVSTLAASASECLYNVLLFVNGGWMIDQRSDGTPDENRQLQMSHLRKLCLPHVARLLQELLSSQKKFKENVQLADIISSERYQLYKEFTQEDLKQFLRVSLDSSFTMLDKNRDPLGYNNP